VLRGALRQNTYSVCAPVSKPFDSFEHANQTSAPKQPESDGPFGLDIGNVQDERSAEYAS
jgi:hypothetical protein